MTSAEVREKLAEALQLDLIGPDNTHAFAHELLPQSPRKWYLTGFLVPSGAPAEARQADDAAEGDPDSPESGTGDDEDGNDKAAAMRFLPSSMGLSFLLKKSTGNLSVTAEWGDYIWEGFEDDDSVQEPSDEDEEEDAKEDERKKHRRGGFRRDPRVEEISVTIPEPGEKAAFPVPNEKGLDIVVASSRYATDSAASLKDTIGVSVFLVNNRSHEERRAYKATAFQAKLRVRCEDGIVGRPNLSGAGTTSIDDRDGAVADLHYRDVLEYAVGHAVSVEPPSREPDDAVREVATTWLPEGTVEKVGQGRIKGGELRIETLGALEDAGAAKSALMPLCEEYRQWIEAQRNKLNGHNLSKPQRETAEELLMDAEFAAQRIEEGIDLLTDPSFLEAFRIANRAVVAAANRRLNPAKPLEWYPFQLAFILLSIRGIAKPEHSDRKRVELLFFPTGGGKTEAYLGLAAFAIVLRRLKNDGLQSAGVSVLMRYTLRLLTLDQLGRAAGMICALELERQKNPELLGTWPFEIGLWVGSAATPNRLGHRGYAGPGKAYTAYQKWFEYKKEPKLKPAPIPLENCPWCDTRFKPHCFHLLPHSGARPLLDLRVNCCNPKCEFSGDNMLPIIGVDEPIYRRLPCFLIATVDKFAALPWTGHVGALFGKVQRSDKSGFYGPCDPSVGTPLPNGELLPPDLIVQDELHLITGPLGTIAGVYETAIEHLCRRKTAEGIEIVPKIVASTATVRRAQSQILALFGRRDVTVFPPPGPDRTDTFFSKTLPTSEANPRLYLGVAAPGRSLKVVYLKSALALLSATLRIYNAEGGGPKNPADPYMTILGYFNSLRELGGTRRIVEDEVYARVQRYGRRKRLEPDDDLFVDRRISYDPTELTSRVHTGQVADAKRRLALTANEKESVDVALATNMISVGLDITRLGLMVVLGQPKTNSEYIQATSRVGRDDQRPGLVVTLLNIHKPRDRSHYERFSAYHSSFYRAVEATSVTPFSPRAMDRALSAALVGLCRLTTDSLTPAKAVSEVATVRTSLKACSDIFADRAELHQEDPDPALRAKVHDLCEALLDDWVQLADQYRSTGSALQYGTESHQVRAMLRDFLDPDLPGLPPLHWKFRANRSMRDVEPSVMVKPKSLIGTGDSSW